MDGAAVGTVVLLGGVVLLVHVEVALRIMGLHGAAHLVGDIRDLPRALAPPAREPDHAPSPEERASPLIIPRISAGKVYEGNRGIIPW